jgi:hypothetical protein
MEYHQTNLFKEKRKKRRIKDFNVQTLYFSSIKEILDYLEQIKINTITKRQSND